MVSAMKRSFAALLVAAAAALLLLPAAAPANTFGFANTDQIDIPTQGAAPTSTINVTGVRGPVTNVQVALNGVYHGRPDDLDVMLVAPDGHGVVLMSDVCGGSSVYNYTWIFQSDGAPNMGNTCGGFTYIPTNMPGEPDAWPDAPPLANGYPMTNWHHKAMNGQWRLYVSDDREGISGKIARGWGLQLTTDSNVNLLPDSGGSGPAQQYPMTRHVDLPDSQVITDLDVDFPLIAHDRPDDLDLLLVGPEGQKVMLMSDACGPSPRENSLHFDDQAPAPLPDDGPCPDVARPADYEPGDAMPPGAPDGPYGTSLSALNGTSPNGDWRLYAVDDSDFGEGYIRYGYDLDIETRDKASVELSSGAVQVPEGQRRAVTITRTAHGPLAEATVGVGTQPGSAAEGADFHSVNTRVHFARNERSRTVVLDAVRDGAAEPAETYSLELSGPTGDAMLGARSHLTATIPASSHAAHTFRCAGQPATIVGTPRHDTLRGTPGPDVIAARGGADRITGAGDVVCGGAGRDRIKGGGGPDHLFGGSGNDRIAGGPARDTCSGGKGRDRVACEVGAGT
jgi:subtilisin-like proprotein convertase family protein